MALKWLNGIESPSGRIARKALKWLNGIESPSGRIARKALELQ